ncbi:aspartate ammonia-lyase [Haloplasma contractile]|uniref:aspartate ammonia-lyase n=1 Tax=Haloplasma contractile SSD-17B TaxID=1033810 RepID=F7PWN4_9MOLU|nr:aspartate ammonia-lyase [Haloplasma contractile]ERJ12594.1 Fumarate hydratase class II protein [Haloplasma contractile SSD-17B]
MDNSRYRIEVDSLGEKLVPIDAYYGIQSLRAKENFQISKQKVHREMIKGVAVTKKAAATANYRAGMLDENVYKSIVKACEEIMSGKFLSQFITDMIQGGAGTSINMNANEVIANRAQEILGGTKGTYDLVHPNDHCNFGQSTNDIIPTGAKIATIKLTQSLLKEMRRLHKAYLDKANEFGGVIKMGRTHLQDAVPIRVGQEFNAFATALERDIRRVESAIEDLKVLNMGATAVGTGLNANKDYVKNIVSIVSDLTNINFKQADDLVDATRNLDPFVWLSSALKTLAVSLSKTANDLRLMASGPVSGFNEITLPQMQPGSSIMPGKVNPVIPEVVNQVSFQVMGNDLTITKAAEAGQLELNVFEPVLLANLFQSLDVLRRGIKTFCKRAVVGITVNKERCISYVERSAGIVTALAPHIGYKRASDLAKEAIKQNRGVRELLVDENILSSEEIEVILNINNMTSPGISGEEILLKRTRNKKVEASQG